MFNHVHQYVHNILKLEVFNSTMGRYANEKSLTTNQGVGGSNPPQRAIKFLQTIDNNQ
jgi:hypothetical protein